MKEQIKIVTKEDIEVQLGKFLPTCEEFNEVPQEDFVRWVYNALDVIKERFKKRNAIPYFQESISKILKSDVEEVEKERLVMKTIEAFDKEFNFFLTSRTDD